VVQVSAPKLAALAAVLVLTLTGCGGPDDETVRPHPTASAAPEPFDDLVDVPVGTGEVGPQHHVRARGTMLVVDGRKVDLAPMRVDEIAVVPGGVFFRNGTELWFTDLARARATGYRDVGSLVASADGTRLGFLDFEHGPRDRFGTPLAIAIAYDATTGKPLLASYAGMGDIAEDDLRDLYEGAEPALIGFDGDALLVRGATGGDYRVPLDGGAPEKLRAG
jgi:hypothetical protein